MRHLLSAASLAAALLLAGCSGNTIKPAAVSGTVSLDGKPLPDRTIIFAGDGKPSETLDIKNGSFSGEVRPGKRTVQFAVWQMTKVKPMPDMPEETVKTNVLPP